MKRTIVPSSFGDIEVIEVTGEDFAKFYDRARVSDDQCELCREQPMSEPHWCRTPDGIRLHDPHGVLAKIQARSRARRQGKKGRHHG